MKYSYTNTEDTPIALTITHQELTLLQSVLTYAALVGTDDEPKANRDDIVNSRWQIRSLKCATREILERSTEFGAVYFADQQKALSDDEILF